MSTFDAAIVREWTRQAAQRLLDMRYDRTARDLEAGTAAALDRLEEVEAERKCTLDSLGDDYAGEFDLPVSKQRPLDSLVVEALAQKDNRIAELEAERDGLLAVLTAIAAYPPHTAWTAIDGESGSRPVKVTCGHCLHMIGTAHEAAGGGE